MHKRLHIWRRCIGSSGFVDWRILISMALTMVAAACGGGGSLHNITNGGPTLAGNTNVNVVLTSTANDTLTTFELEFLTITLTNQAGKNVSLLASQQPFESIHLNGNIEPFLTASIPQDVYTSASATIGAADFLCATLVPSGQPNAGGLATSEFAYGATPNANVTVNLPSPLLVHGNNMTLLLNMDVSKSASFQSCFSSGGLNPFAITPTFNLTPVNFPVQPTNALNGKVTALDGIITAVDSTKSIFTFSIPEGSVGTRNLSVKYDTNTVFQGISDFSATPSSTFADIDGAIQQDGSLLATRVSVEDPTAVNVIEGPVLQVSNGLVANLTMDGRLETGPLLTRAFNNTDYLGVTGINFSNATFQTARQFTNLGDLPFVPVFLASNMVPGQNISVGTPIIEMFPPTANTITLIPQTVNGTVIATSTSGNFNVYTVKLADYDLFATLAVPGTPPALTNPNEVHVYVDGDTQITNKTTLGPGSTFRFQGLVFNDNGTLRMDCSQVADGVAE